MKIAFPAQDNLGIESPVYNHFGSANFFVIVETGSNDIKAIVNEDRDHVHGQCQPLSALGGNKVDAVAVGGIGGGALRKLYANGIKVYRAVEGSVNENLELIKSRRLPEFRLDQTCAGHGTNGECIH